MLLQVKKLCKSYGGALALDDVSFNLKAGEVVGLVGDNGAGKSTLAKSLSGAIRFDSGSILIEENLLSMGTPKQAQAAGIEMVYQNLALCPERTAVQNIFLGRELVKYGILQTKQMEQEAASLLKRIGANLSLNKPVQLLSGGQQQAVAIARALLSKPKLVLLDEPTSALAEKEVQKVLSLIKSLKKQKIGVILISHRLSDVFAVSDRILMLEHGKLKNDAPIKGTSLKKVTEFLLGS